MFLLWLSWSLGASHLCMRAVEALLAFRSSQAEIRLMRHDKISLFLLLLHCTITVLFFYNFCRGQHVTNQLSLALLNTVFLTYNAYGYFRCSSVWHRFYSNETTKGYKDCVLLTAFLIAIPGLAFHVLTAIWLVQTHWQETRGD